MQKNLDLDNFYMFLVNDLKYGSLRNPKIYFVTADGFGKILHLYSLSDQMFTPCIDGTKIHVDYKVSTEQMSHSVLEAFRKGLISVSKFI